MDKKFDKYWDVNYNMVLVIATILDPRHKFDFPDFFYEKVCENFVDIDLSKNMAKDWLGKYFRKYEEVIRRNGTSLGPQVDVSNSMASYSPVLMQGKRKFTGNLLSLGLREEGAGYKNQNWMPISKNHRLEKMKILKS